MQLILLALILGIFLHDALPQASAVGPQLHGMGLLAAVLLPKVAIMGGYWLLCVTTRKRLGSRSGHRAMRRLDKATSLYRMFVLGLYAADLCVGWIAGVRHALGDLILLDELVIIAPSLAMLVWAWWAYYPIDRRMREATLISKLDAGMPIYPIHTRAQYMLAQVRHQVALILLPLMAIIAWVEAVDQMGPAHWAAINGDPRPILVLPGSIAIFMLAPLLIRHVWDTTPLPKGELRDHLLAMCKRHRVGVRELLLWRTFGGMINAAVMGIVAPLRFILLTDALVEMVRAEQVEAIMAHEIAHVRCKHMFWLLATALGSLGLVELGFGVALTAMDRTAADAAAAASKLAEPVHASTIDQWLASPELALLAAAVIAGLCWAAIFGYVSRRIERQADTFAVQDLARQRQSLTVDSQGNPLIDADSAQTMIDALQQVADLNHIPIQKNSWRHGSIAWRQNYLRSLIGKPIDHLPIYRQMRWINLASLASVLLVIAVQLLLQTGLLAL